MVSAYMGGRRGAEEAERRGCAEHGARDKQVGVVGPAGSWGPENRSSAPDRDLGSGDKEGGGADGQQTDCGGAWRAPPAPGGGLWPQGLRIPRGRRARGSTFFTIHALHSRGGELKTTRLPVCRVGGPLGSRES